MKKQLGRKNAVCRDRSDTPDRFRSRRRQKSASPSFGFAQRGASSKSKAISTARSGSNRTSLPRPPTARCLQWVSRDLTKDGAPYNRDSIHIGIRCRFVAEKNPAKPGNCRKTRRTTS